MHIEIIQEQIPRETSGFQPQILQITNLHLTRIVEVPQPIPRNHQKKIFIEKFNRPC